jgi:hypothetical protein
MVSTTLRGTLLAGALLLGALPAASQTVTLDEGTFRILLDGTEVGMETFSIRQNGSGEDAVVIARGRVVLDAGRGGTEVQASVQLAGGGLRPAAYDMEVRGGDAQRINARVVGSRVSARISAAAGENMREYLVSDGAVLVDDGVAHHYYFIARRAAGSALTVPIMIPRGSRQVSAQVAVSGSEEVAIGNRRVPATHYTVQPAGGALAHVWADAQGRILKVEVPSRKYTAVRTAAP